MAAFDETRHLLARTGFGVPVPGDVAALQGLGYPAAVAKILDGVRAEPARGEPDWLGSMPFRPPRYMSAQGRKDFQSDRRDQGRQLKVWWYGEMLNTPSPFTEHMTLFWHGHFTSSLRKVKIPDMLYAQNALFRKHAVGNFATMLRAVARDPAMIVYLDTDSNTREAPNENFARELMELFTLGEGMGYTEQDVVDAARAFAGWRLSPHGGFQFGGRDRDIGQKTFLGRTGRFDGDDILDILLEQPRLAEHITEKLWREFVSPDPDPAEVRRLAAVFRDSGYELRPLLQALFESPAFRDPAVRGALVKSPVDVIVGTLRLVGYREEAPSGLRTVGASLGQDVFDPPNVKGWPGGLAWIDTSLLPDRYGFVSAVAETVPSLRRGAPPEREVLRAAGSLKLREVDPGAVQALSAMQSEQIVALLLPLAPAGGTGASGLAGYLLDPTYQLK